MKRKPLSKKITDAQVNEFVKEVRADVDKEVSESNKTFEANLKKKFNFVAKQTEPGGKGGKDDEPDPNDISAVIKAAVAEAVKPFQEELSGYKADNIAKARLQALNEKLNGCKDENFKSQTLKDFARMNFKDDADFNEYLTGKATDIETANQNVANDKLNNAGEARFSHRKKKVVFPRALPNMSKAKSPAKTISRARKFNF